MTPSLCKLSHVALSTPDLERSLWFFRDVVGMEEVESDGTRVYLRCWAELDHHSLSLREGPVGVEHICFRTGGAEDLGLFAAQLRGAGVEVEEVPAGDEAGQGDAVRFTMPHAEIPLELVWDIDKPLSPEGMRSKLPTASTKMWRQGASPRRIDHVNIQTAADGVALADRFASEQLGFKRREYFQPTGGPLLLSFMSVTSQVHDLGITPDSQNRPGRLHHVALGMEDMAAILRAADIMREHDIEVDIAPGRHGIAQSFFFYMRDPGSNHRLELYAGGYPIYDPDWDPPAWNETNIDFGAVFFGPPFAPGDGGPMDSNTPCAIQADAAVATS